MEAIYFLREKSGLDNNTDCKDGIHMFFKNKICVATFEMMMFVG